jgi:hypothetical protein
VVLKLILEAHLLFPIAFFVIFQIYILYVFDSESLCVRAPCLFSHLNSSSTLFAHTAEVSALFLFFPFSNYVSRRVAVYFSHILIVSRACDRTLDSPPCLFNLNINFNYIVISSGGFLRFCVVDTL